MRIKPQPMRGKYRVVEDTLVKVKNLHATVLARLPESVLNPGWYTLPKDTILSITSIKETVNTCQFNMSVPKSYNKKNPWAGISIGSFSCFEDFDVEVEKLP